MTEEEYKNMLIEVSNWELDTTSEFPVVRNLATLGRVLMDDAYLKHEFVSTVYAISRVKPNDDEHNPVVDIDFFEVNMPFRNERICKFALYNAVRIWDFDNMCVKTTSISPESDPFYLSVGLKRDGTVNGFYGDEKWLPNFIREMENEDLKSIYEEIKSIRNQICDEELRQMNKLRELSE